jgi:hypothetical protein
MMLAPHYDMDMYDILVTISPFFLPAVGIALGLVMLMDRDLDK